VSGNIGTKHPSLVQNQCYMVEDALLRKVKADLTLNHLYLEVCGAMCASPSVLIRSVQNFVRSNPSRLLCSEQLPLAGPGSMRVVSITMTKLQKMR
jgi:hypothetical protein